MRIRDLIAGVCQLLAIASALPGLEERGPKCCKDACEQAVLSGPESHGYLAASVTAKADCSSYLVETVTPCPVTRSITIKYTGNGKTTVTKTVTENAYARVSTTTVDVGRSITAISTKPVTLTSTNTLVVTQTAISSTVSTSAITSTEVASFTITAPPVTETVTVTNTAIPNTSIPRKRSFETSHAFEAHGQPIAPKCPFTNSQTKIPSYATACREHAAYSSACSCMGVKESTKTLPQSTSTKTISTECAGRSVKTVTITATRRAAAATITKTNTVLHTISQTITARHTAILTTTKTTTITIRSTSTFLSTSTITSTPTSTDTTTVTATATSCAYFNLQYSSGPETGQFLSRTGSQNYQKSNTDPASAAQWYLSPSDSSLIQISSTPLLGACIPSRPVDEVYMIQQPGRRFTPLICSITPDGSGDDLDGDLRCSATTGENTLYVCAEDTDGGLLFGTDDAVLNVDGVTCTLLKVGVRATQVKINACQIPATGPK